MRVEQMYNIIKYDKFTYESASSIRVQLKHDISSQIQSDIHLDQSGIYNDNVKYQTDYLQMYLEQNNINDSLDDWVSADVFEKYLIKADSSDSMIKIKDICFEQFDSYVREVQHNQGIDSEGLSGLLYSKNILVEIFQHVYEDGYLDGTIANHEIFKLSHDDILFKNPDSNRLQILEVPFGLTYNEGLKDSCGIDPQVLSRKNVWVYNIYSGNRHRITQRSELEAFLKLELFDEDEEKVQGKAFKERYLSALGLRDKDFVKWLTRYLSNSLNEETKASSEKIVKAIECLVDTEKSIRESDQTKIDSLNETVSKLNDLISSNTESNNQIKQAIASLTEAYKQINKKADKVEEIQQDQFDLQDAKKPDEIIRDVEPGSCDILDKIKSILKFKKAVILAGAPGTGKTTIARCIAKEITSDNVCDNAYVEIKRDNGTQYIRYEDKLKGALKKYLEVVQFSAQYSYEDFVSGLKTDENGNWTLTPGAFKLMCDKAQADQNQKNKYVLIIDEINRANTEEVLGEMFNLMESRNIEITSRTGEKLVMPENLYIIATMNSIDRGAGQLDMATISRFAVVNIEAPSAKQMINNVDKILACDKHPELKDKLIVAIGLISKLNKLISEDNDAAVLNKEALKLGYRSLFSEDISQTDDINLIIEYDIKSDIDARQDKLSKQTYEKCIEEIYAAIKTDKAVEKPDETVEDNKSEAVETGEQS